MIQDLMARLKDESIRKDFLKGQNGACQVDAAEMEVLEKFARSVVTVRPSFSNEPNFSQSAKSAADFLSSTIDGRNRQFMETGFAYDKIKELLNRIQSCGYWERDVKIVVEKAPEPVAPKQQEDSESADEKFDEPKNSKSVPSAPAPTQVPAPIFNGAPQQQQRGGRQTAQQQQQPPPVPTVSAVEHEYFNQIKYSQPQGPSAINNNNNNNGPTLTNPLQEVISSANFSFLQDSELDSPSNVVQLSGSQQQQQKLSSQKHIQRQNQPSPQQQQQQQQQTYTNQNFHQQAAFPPGLSLPQQQQQQMQNTVPIPVNYQSNSATQVPTHMIPPQVISAGGNQQISGGYPVSGGLNQQQQQQQQQRSYQSMIPAGQFQQQQQQPLHQQQQQAANNMHNNTNLQNVKHTEQQKSSTSVSQKPDVGLKNVAAAEQPRHSPLVQEKEKSREDWQNQQQPQIDTWTNETATGKSSSPHSGGNSNNYSSRSSGGFNRSGGNKYGGGGGGSGTGAERERGGGGYRGSNGRDNNNYRLDSH